MGKKSPAETVVAIYQAFLQARTWKQAELAERIGIQPPALRKWLLELGRTGMPLDREEEHPHVFWSVPPGWFPGGVVLGAGDVAELLRQLFRLPRSKARDQLVRRLLEATHGAADPGRERAVVAPEASAAEESLLPVVEDAVVQRRPLSFRYYSARRGMVEARRASVQRVIVGPPARFVAVCHRDGALKWFRLERVSAARLDPSEPYREIDPAQVDAVLRESVDGFHQGGDAVACSFTVTDPEARWVTENLPAPMHHEPIPDGVRLSTITAGVLPLARFVVGLGAAARAETPELRALVAELARGALSAPSLL